MKVKIELDVTPQELRAFFGLPDVEPLHEEMLDRVREQMRAGAEGFDATKLLQPLLPGHLQAMESMQRAMWNAFSGALKGKDSDDEDDEERQ